MLLLLLLLLGGREAPVGEVEGGMNLFIVLAEIILEVEDEDEDIF